MTDGNGLPFAGALGAVREIEAAIQARDTARDAADGELEAARAEAERLLVEARREGAAAGHDRHEAILATAQADAAAIRAAGLATAARVVDRARAQAPDVVAMLLPLLLPQEG